MKRKPSTSSKGNQQSGYQVWHFALAVPAIAITLQLMLGSLTPLPDEHKVNTTRYAAAYHGDFYGEHHYDRLPEMEILPLNLRGEMTGPLLASVIQQYLPGSTEQHAADLRDTLPPSDDPRLIVILPKGDDEPLF